MMLQVVVDGGGRHGGASGRREVRGEVMPLRDHFHPPLEKRRHREGFHSQWPAVIVQHLAAQLPPRYFAEPRVHAGSRVEIAVATFQEKGGVLATGNGNGGGVATAVRAPPQPTRTFP